MSICLPKSRSRRACLLLLPLAVLALPGCGPNGFARDSLIESTGAEGFLDRIQTGCGKLSVGNQPLNWLLSSASNDTTFVDMASKYYSGQFTAKAFADGINAFYPTGTNQPALDCIASQLPQGANPGG